MSPLTPLLALYAHLSSCLSYPPSRPPFSVLQSPIVTKLIEMCNSTTENPKVQLDAAWSLCNIISQGTQEQAEYVCQIGAITAITSTLHSKMVRGGGSRGG